MTILAKIEGNNDYALVANTVEDPHDLIGTIQSVLAPDDHLLETKVEAIVYTCITTENIIGELLI